MKLLTKKWWRKWLREIHRDLGYLAVGITVIYAISGIILNHKDAKEDPSYKTISTSRTIEANLGPNSLIARWDELDSGIELVKVFPKEDYFVLYLKGGMGDYDPVNGLLNYEIYKKKPIVYYFNKLQYNQQKGWKGIADLYAGVLIFLAISGLFMTRGSKGLAGPRIWFFIGGILLSLVFIWL